MKSKYSKTDGENRIVDGDIVQFTANNEENLEQRIDTREDTDMQNNDNTQIPQLEINGLHAIFYSKTIDQFTNYDTKISVAELKAAMKDFLPYKDTYFNTQEALIKAYNNIEKLGGLLEKFIDKSSLKTLAGSDVDIPNNTRDYILYEIRENINDINMASSGPVQSEKENPDITKNVTWINNITKDLYATRKLAQTCITLEFLKKNQGELMGEIRGLEKKKIERWERYINNDIPDHAITVKENIVRDDYTITVIDPAPIPVQVPITPPPTKKSLYESIKDRIKGR